MKKYTLEELQDIDNLLTPIKKEIYETVIERYNPTADLIRKGGSIGAIGMVAAMMGSIPTQKIKHQIVAGEKSISHLKALKRINKHSGKEGVDKYVESKTKAL
eukprot:GHVR01186779.1.p1 GENE.GHVR01186779.1~~GHVR01186779.1.p1  ORF type:complete len:103 (-),score=11.57 GHVR01186779.1:350-658(-)